MKYCVTFTRRPYVNALSLLSSDVVLKDLTWLTAEFFHTWPCLYLEPSPSRLASCHKYYLNLGMAIHFLPSLIFKSSCWQNATKSKHCSLMYRVVHGSAPTYLTELRQPCSDTRLRSTSRGDFIVPRFNRQLSNSSFSFAAPSAWNRLPSHIRTSSTYTLFLTRLKIHLFAESLLWHCYAVVFSLYFWRPRALDEGRHSKFMLIDWLIVSVWTLLC